MNWTEMGEAIGGVDRGREKESRLLVRVSKKSNLRLAQQEN